VSTVAELLRRKAFRDASQVISEGTSLRDAALRLGGHQSNTALLVVRDAEAVAGSGGGGGDGVAAGGARRVVGLLSASDVLRAMRDSPGTDPGAVLSRPSSTVMTPSARVVYASPSDTLLQCSILMTELRVSHLPVQGPGGEVVGVMSLADIVAFTVEALRGGKPSWVQHVLPRRGLSADARVARTSGDGALVGPDGAPMLQLATGAAALPRAQPVAEPTEDAFFVAHVAAWRGAAGGAAGAAGAAAAAAGPPPPTVTYMGVADGVGSWRAVGVDPHAYAQRLMEAAAEAVWKAALDRASPPPTPLEVLTAAWQATTAEQVVGSATAAVLMLDGAHAQLSVHGVGDCGVILLRDTDIERVGTLLRGGTQAGIRPGWRVSARATQQLKGFNQPYQLGYAPGQDAARFETPRHGETLVLPVQPGDVVIAATDGCVACGDAEGGGGGEGICVRPHTTCCRTCRSPIPATLSTPHSFPSPSPQPV
jgi:protein phosphatase PTC7